ncbi:MAG: metal ABC transporter permease, partial [Tepidisphaeraceae bacterium]
MLDELINNSHLHRALLAGVAMSIACGLLSVFVVSQRWAFIGEGISHAGLGGAGTAWLAALLVPALDTPVFAYTAIVCFCLATALAIGWVSHPRGRRGVNSDAAIGIFLVATLAWGFLAQNVYARFRGSSPFGFDNILFGQMRALSPAYVLVAVAACAGVVFVVVMLHKEILAYCFDPMMAEVSGVRAGAMHYLLMV